MNPGITNAAKGRCPRTTTGTARIPERQGSSHISSGEPTHGARISSLSRIDDLVINDLETETIVYDTDVHHIHCLNDVSRTVWRLCNGHRTIPALARLTALDEPTVRDTLTKLSDACLLTEPLSPGLRLHRSSRRTLGKRAGIALGTIISISAPTAAAAVSPSTCGKQGDYCVSHVECCNGYCIDVGQYNPYCN